MKTVLEFKQAKLASRPITMLTSYDAWSARLLNQSPVDCILVGDSAAMVMHGESSTIPATLEMLEFHTRAVARGAPSKFIIADLPFLSFRQGIPFATAAAGRLLQAGAHAVKLEGVAGHEEVVAHLVGSGIPVMGHLGLTPQFIHQFGGFKVQGTTAEARENILLDARKLESLGVFALVLECVPEDLAREITRVLSIPTIGIGAGTATDGQVLVLHDLLGLNSSFKPRFVRHFLNGETLIQNAIKEFHHAVVEKTFPAENEKY